MTKAQAESILAEQKQASAEENTNKGASILAYSGYAGAVRTILRLWATAKRFRLDGNVNYAFVWESAAERLISDHGLDW